MPNRQDGNKRKADIEASGVMVPVDRSELQREEVTTILVELWRRDLDQQRRLELIRQAWELAAAHDPRVLPLFAIIGPPVIETVVAQQRQTAAIENLAASMQESNRLREKEIKAANRQGCFAVLATIIAPLSPAAASVAFGLTLQALAHWGTTETVAVIIVAAVLLYFLVAGVLVAWVAHRRHGP